MSSYFVSTMSASFPLVFHKIGDKDTVIDLEKKTISYNPHQKDDPTSEDEEANLRVMKLKEVHFNNLVLKTLLWVLPSVIAILILYFISALIIFYVFRGDPVFLFSIYVVFLAILSILALSIAIEYDERKTDLIVIALSLLSVSPILVYGILKINAAVFTSGVLLLLVVMLFLESVKPILKLSIFGQPRFFLYGKKIKFLLIKGE